MAIEKRWKFLGACFLAFIAVLIIGVLVVYWTTSTTVVFVVRHAERDDTKSCTTPVPGGTPNPPLSTVGDERSLALRHTLEDTGIQAIYASELCRTQQTVDDLASQLGLPVIAVDQHAPDNSGNVDDLVAQVIANNPGQKVLIAGHGETVPMIIEKLGGGTIDPIGGSEFDNLYVITTSRWWFFKSTRMIRLKYGAPT
jgi:broad specificity phosphatase PhoE